MNRKSVILLLAIFVALTVVLAGCKVPVVPSTPKGVISGKVLIPPTTKELSRDITGWVPAMGAAVTIEDTNGKTRTATTDANGKYSFENIKVNPNTIITASITVNGKKIVLKAVIPQKIEADEVYDAGKFMPESIALALVVEKLSHLKKDIDLKKIKDTKPFLDLIDEVQDLLEKFGDITNDDNIAGLTDEIIEEVYPDNGGNAVKVSAVSIITSPPNVSGMANNAEVIVILSTATSGATVYYTLNGTTPTSSSNKYSIPFSVKTSNPIGEAVTVKAIGVKSGLASSVVSEKEIIFRVKTHTVTFMDYTGTVLDTKPVEHGQAATAPDGPTREGYTFSGWDIDFSNVTDDLTVTAQYTVNQYTITFDSVDGSAVTSTTQDYGSTVTAPDDPTKDGYTFNGWAPAVPVTMPANNMTCVAQWEEIEVIAISVKAQPTKLNYVAGQLLNLNGLAVTLTYNDNSIEDVSLASFGSKGVTADPTHGATLSIDSHNSKPVVLTCNGKTANTNNLTVAAKELNIIAGSKSVEITSNYGDVVTETTSVTITINTLPDTWHDFGGKLQAKIITAFPANMTNLTLTPNPSTNIISISGMRRSGYSVTATDLTIQVCDKDDASVTNLFTVTVSGSGTGNALTIKKVT